MANSSTYGSYTDLAHEDLTCPLCFEFLVDPHTPLNLSCPHVYCYTCLQRMVVKGQTQIDCPECRLPTSIPPQNGILALKVNTRLRSLAQKHLHVQSGEPKHSLERLANLTCPICFEFLKDPHTPKELGCAHVYCCLCLNALADKKHNIACPKCKQKTKLSKGRVDDLKTNLRLRSLVEKHLKKPGKKADDDDGVGMTCPHHQGESMPFHCSTCSKAICQFCLLHTHRRHDVKEQNQLVQEKKTQLGRIMQEALRDVDGYKNRIDKLRVLDGDIESTLKKEEEAIDRCVAKAVQMAHSTGQVLKKQLRQTEQQRLLGIREEVALLQKKIDEIKTGQRTAKKDIDLLTYESHTEQCSVVAGKLNRLCLKEQTTGTRFDKIDMAKFVSQRKVKLGRIVAPLRLQLVQEFGDFSGANAIGASVTSDDHIIVNDFGSGQVQVYTYQPYEYKHKCDLELSKANACQVRDVAVNVREEFLVARGTGVEVYTTDGKYKKTIASANMDNAMQEASSNIFSVSTANQEGRILVGDTERRIVTEHRFKTNRIIKTSVKPGSIAFISDTHMVVTDKFGGGDIRVQSLTTGKESLQLTIPGAQGVCYENKSDCILVLRSEIGDDPGHIKLGTGVLEQYCRISGRQIGCLLQGLYQPRAIVFTSEDMLAIADQKTVKIYKIS